MMRHALSIAAFSASVAGCATPEYRSAKIERNLGWGGGQITLNRADKVRKLATAFPGVGTITRPDDMTMGSIPAYFVSFTRDDGKVDVVSTSGKCDWATFDSIVAGRFPVPTTSPTPGK